MEDLIKDLQGQLEINAFNYNEALLKVKAGEANYHPLTLQAWEDRIQALAEAIGILTKHLNK